MAWTYNNTTTPGVLTSTGATEASPDSLLAGIAIVQAANPARGYRNGLVAWLENVQVNGDLSFIRIDADSTIDLRGSSFIDPNRGGVMHDWRSTLIISTNTNRIDNALNFDTGSTFICRRQRPSDPSPKIVYNTGARHDYPNIQERNIPAKVIIDGLDCYGVQGAGMNLKVYFGRATVSSVSNLRFFSQAQGQFFSSTYNDGYAENLGLGSEGGANNVVFNRHTYYLPSPTQFGGALRGCSATLNNPTFLNNCWNGAVNFNDRATFSKLTLQYSYVNQFRSGLDPVEGVTIRFVRARQAVTGAAAWTAPYAVITATSDAQGVYTPVNLIDAYREGAVQFDIERFNWTAKARSYARRTAGENLFTNRVLYRANVDMSAGYSEEVQMLDVQHLTLTEAQAAALTGIALVADGATGGTVTITENTTAAELWAAYRNWISMAANFDSEDTWSLTGSTIDLGAWSMVVNGATFTGNVTTTGTVTTPNSGAITGFAVDANGVLFAVSGLDPQSLGATWTLGYITESDYQNRDQNAAPATWTGWTQINGTGNVAQVQLAQDTAYRLFHRAPGYDNTTDATVDTGETFSTVMAPIADRDLQGALLWPQTAAHATQAGQFSYSATDGLVDYDNQTGSTDYIPFLAGYRAFGNIVYSPALTFYLRFLPRVNATKDGFVLDPDATLTLRMSDASDASAILEADLAYTNGQKAYDRFVANANHLFLLYAQMSEVLSSSSVQQVASAVDQSAVLAKEATVEGVANGVWSADTRTLNGALFT